MFILQKNILQDNIDHTSIIPVLWPDSVIGDSE